MGTKPKEQATGTVIGGQSEHDSTNTGIHVGSAPAKSPRAAKPRRRIVLSLVLVLLLLAGAGVVAKRNADTRAEKSKAESAAVVPKTPENDAQKIVSEFIDQADHSPAALQASVAKLAALETSAKSSEEKQQYRAAIIQLQMQVGDYATALVTAKQADETYKSATTAGLLASIYELQQDYANAAANYKLAVERSPKTSPQERSPYNEYLAKQHEMEAKL